jgi:hypothetical protein
VKEIRNRLWNSSRSIRPATRRLAPGALPYFCCEIYTLLTRFPRKHFIFVIWTPIYISGARKVETCPRPPHDLGGTRA